MNCKFCNEPLEKGATICPHCQKEQPPAPKKPKVWQLVVAIFACVVLLGALTVAVLEGAGIDATGKIAQIMPWNKNDKKAEEEKAPEEPLESDVVVATIGDRTLTNGELQVYYSTHLIDYINANYYYGLPFNTDTALDVQVKDTATGQTWHDYFLDMAFKTWQRYEAMSIIAEENGVTYSKDTQDYLDGLEEYLTTAAEENGFASADEMIADRFGEGCAFRHYYAFMENYCIGLDFVGIMSDSLSLTEEELESYYNANLEELDAAGATKEDGNISDVRHILISPESTTENGTTTISDAQWAAALARAEEILAQWNAGEATEASFTALAKEHSDDPGVTTNEGLYQQVTLNSGYVAAFEAWANDATREAGQAGIVKTEYGYHIMYCVATQPLWRYTCQQAYVTDQLSIAINKTVEENPMTTDMDKVVLSDILAQLDI